MSEKSRTFGQKLPDGWKQMIIRKHRRPYYVNEKTGQSVWKFPSRNDKYVPVRAGTQKISGTDRSRNAKVDDVKGKLCNVINEKYSVNSRLLLKSKLKSEKDGSGKYSANTRLAKLKSKWENERHISGSGLKNVSEKSTKLNDSKLNTKTLTEEYDTNIKSECNLDKNLAELNAKIKSVSNYYSQSGETCRKSLSSSINTDFKNSLSQSKIAQSSKNAADIPKSDTNKTTIKNNLSKTRVTSPVKKFCKVTSLNQNNVINFKKLNNSFLASDLHINKLVNQNDSKMLKTSYSHDINLINTNHVSNDSLKSRTCCIVTNQNDRTLENLPNRDLKRKICEIKPCKEFSNDSQDLSFIQRKRRSNPEVKNNCLSSENDETVRFNNLFHCSGLNGSASKEAEESISTKVPKRIAEKRFDRNKNILQFTSKQLNLSKQQSNKYSANARLSILKEKLKKESIIREKKSDFTNNNNSEEVTLPINGIPVLSESEIDCSMEIDVSEDKNENDESLIMEWEPINQEEVTNEVCKMRSNTSSTIIETADWATHHSLNIDYISGEKLLIVLDTNVLLSDLCFVSRLKNIHFNGYGEPILIIPFGVIQELDHFKQKKCKLQQVARYAIRYLHDHFKDKESSIIGQSFDSYLQLAINTVDDSIIKYCSSVLSKGKRIILVTEDMNLRNKAFVNQIKAFSKDELTKSIDS